MGSPAVRSAFAFLVRNAVAFLGERALERSDEMALEGTPLETTPTPTPTPVEPDAVILEESMTQAAAPLSADNFIWYVFLAAITAAVCYLIYKKTMNYLKQMDDGRYTYTRESVKPSAKNQKRGENNLPRGNKAIRKIYRKLLALFSAKGFSRQPWHTSADVNARMEHGALRDIYIHARYNDEANPSNDEIRRAKEAYKKCHTATDGPR
jgi:hypothetical protein